MSRIQTVKQATDNIGKRLYWDDNGPKLTIVRSGILTSVFRRQICFGDSQDYRHIRDFSSLRTTEIPT